MKFDFLMNPAGGARVVPNPWLDGSRLPTLLTRDEMKAANPNMQLCLCSCYLSPHQAPWSFSGLYISVRWIITKLSVDANFGRTMPIRDRILLFLPIDASNLECACFRSSCWYAHPHIQGHHVNHLSDLPAKQPTKQRSSAHVAAA
jgi:hypothetical protein